MRLDTNKLASAVRVALSLGFATVGVVGTAQAQTAGNATDQKSQNLDTIVVTGSNIRRVDTETASPVITIDRAAIQQSGKLTLGDLVQQLPSMAGAATNPQVNNGGGAGTSAISLRGLGSQRTLMLVNGHRVAFQDANQVPANAVERIEVLTDGASAVYGSEAIGGVVNFILRSNYQGAEFSTEYGITDHDDGERKGYHFSFGQTTDKGSIMAGVNYVKNGSISASNRKFSSDALYLYAGRVVKGGSSRAATGRVDLPNNVPLPGGLTGLGCHSFTLKSGGVGASLGDYRCYEGSDANGNLKDAYNFQANGNYDLTPAERTGVFVLGSYNLTDHVEAYLEVFHSKYSTGSSQAQVPFDTATDATISKDNYYNPFGVDFAPGGATRYRERLVSLGPRLSNSGVVYDQVNTGFKGTFLDNWAWNANFSFGHRSRDNVLSNYMNYGSIANGFGPSFKNSAGVVQCGTADAPIALADCTPINIFNQADPATALALEKGKSSYFFHFLQTYKQGDVGVNGGLFDLPAGSVEFAGGLSNRKQYEHDTVDSVATAQPPIYISCAGGSSICAGPTQGGFSVKEGYAELLVPLLKDLPFVNSLKLDLGDRYSKYSNFGSTNNWKIALEYRPIEDLMLRGTASKVFRAPTLTDIYAGPASSNPAALDPCNGATINSAAAHNPACAGIPFNPNGSPFQTTNTAQIEAIVSGAKSINYAVQPEHGKSYDYGFVYDPHWLPGLSVSADLWRVSLQNLILSASTGDAAYILQNCYQSNGGPNCKYIHRTPAGDIFYVQAGTINGGSLETTGADFNLRYRMSETPFGNFAFNLQTAYISKYDITTAGVQHYAGHFDATFGNYARVRALAGVDWNLGAFSANWTVRYIGPFKNGYPNSALGGSADATGTYDPPAIPVLHFGSQTYHNVSVGYNIEPLNTSIRVGVDNLADKQPPIIFFENTLNANTDVNTYDTVGRFYFGSITVKF